MSIFTKGGIVGGQTIACNERVEVSKKIIDTHAIMEEKKDMCIITIPVDGEYSLEGKFYFKKGEELKLPKTKELSFRRL